jgi:hypothetical protein
MFLGMFYKYVLFWYVDVINKKNYFNIFLSKKYF